MKILNQKGLTLIEILAAVVILMIVIVGFLSFFSQATSHSRITEDKLTAINLAEKVLVKAKKPDFDIVAFNAQAPEKINGKEYYPHVTFMREQTSSESKLRLVRVKVEIFNKGSGIPTRDALTELYSYR